MRRPAPSPRPTRPLALLLLALMAAAPAALARPAAEAAPAAPVGLCQAAIARAEREGTPGLPPRLLAAIGRVESGRRDPVTGAFGPWPWTINAEGRGSFFPDKAAAIAAVRALQARGVRSIDVGCMQVNLRHHPNAFASLEQAFDPLTNARYAARFLRELHAGPAGGNWLRAASFYHSQTPGFAAAYLSRVAQALTAEGGQPGAAGTALAVAGPAGLTNRFEGTGLRAPQSPGGGRGLDAYRAAPIPLTAGTRVASPRLLTAVGPDAAADVAPAPGGRGPLLPAIGGRGPLFASQARP